MNLKILFVDSDSGLIKSIKPYLENYKVDYFSNSDLEKKLVMEKTFLNSGYSIDYYIPKNELNKIINYDFMFINTKSGQNMGLTLALNLTTKSDKIYLMSYNTLFINKLVEQKKLSGYVHKTGDFIERILDLIK